MDESRAKADRELRLDVSARGVYSEEGTKSRQMDGELDQLDAHLYVRGLSIDGMGRSKLT